MLFSSLAATTGIGTPTLAQAAASCPSPAKKPGVATHDERPQVARMKNDLMSFVLCPYNVANEPRAALPGSHKTVGRVGSICVLDGRSNEPSSDATFARA